MTMKSALRFQIMVWPVNFSLKLASLLIKQAHHYSQASCISPLCLCCLFFLQVIMSTVTAQSELELFPRYLLFLRQQPATRSPQSNIWVNMGMSSLRMFPPHMPRGNVSLQQERGYRHCLDHLL